MRFLVDMCTGGKLAVRLEERGYDVAQVRKADSSINTGWGQKKPRSGALAPKGNLIHLALASGFNNISFFPCIRTTDLTFPRSAGSVQLPFPSGTLTHR
ncbi:hypothetical protein SAMN00808754_2363 [Thermanaeromonas toyohensis ToBE]|uniref:Uncharacterized protein n=1 Tax=Thermanaeromonas toyohensis ToBE TaxID=698762 RepID=A0A1W1VYM9_9FIRM|nr:hypothetical protein SAMN00808754_2363 [Thermanaeromonas toyohensis ToBE]